MTEPRRDFALWLFVAFAIRVIGAATHSSFASADEWFQTVEFGHYLSDGFGAYSQEVSLHLRNMTWPVLIAGSFKLAHWIDPHSVWFRVFLYQLLSGILDLGIAWGWWRMARTLGVSRKWMNAGFALVILPWFTAKNSIRPSAEHLSAAMLWIALGFATMRCWTASGFFSVAIVAFRYPSGFFSVGLGVSVALRAIRRRDYSFLWKFAVGAGIGLFVFGLPDFWVYGRPWESLWMYTQYNVFLGLGAKVFGKQGAIVYWSIFHDEWFRALLPLGIALALSSAYGFWKGLSRFEEWAWASIFFLVPHFFVAHKEPRFILPMDALFLWGAYEGAYFLSKTELVRRIFSWHAWKVIVTYVVCANALLLVHTLIGESFVSWQTYLRVGNWLEKYPEACAVITSRPLVSSTQPRVEAGEIWGPGSVAWPDHLPSCVEKEHFLLNLNRPDLLWEKSGCELLPSGVLAVLPRASWGWVLKKDLLRGPWYRCPARALAKFRDQTVEHPYFTRIKKLPELPPLGISAEMFMKEIVAITPSSECNHLCSGMY